MWTATALYRARWFILGFTTIAVIASIAIALSLTRWYGATVRVLPPESGDGGLGAIIGDLSPVASSLLGGGGGSDYTRYLAVLTSRTVHERVVDRFDLVDVYDLGETTHPVEEALAELRNNVAVEVDLQYEYLAITAFDTSPDRSAQMANFFASELNRRNQELAVQNASGFRGFVERRYQEIELRLDSSRAELQAFQERNGVIELPAMAQGLMESLAGARAEAGRAEIQYRALLSEFGPENPQVMAANEALAAAREAESDLLGGREALMPVPLRNLPAVANEYAQAYQEVLIQQSLLEGARPLLEQARFEEARERTAVQVLDPATPPVMAARPSKRVVVMAGALSAFLIACGLVLARGVIREWGIPALRRVKMNA